MLLAGFFDFAQDGLKGVFDGVQPVHEPGFDTSLIGQGLGKKQFKSRNAEKACDLAELIENPSQIFQELGIPFPRSVRELLEDENRPSIVGTLK